MKHPGSGLRVTSSIFFSILLGLVAATTGLSLLTSDIIPLSENSLGPVLALSFTIGVLLMWPLHNIYHRWLVPYILILIGAIPLILIGVILGVLAYDTLDSLPTSNGSEARGSSSGFGAAMMLMGIGISILMAGVGLIATISAILGLVAYHIRAKASRLNP